MGETKKKKQDFDWMIKLCEPTQSQHQKLINCPFSREFDTFNESLLMSSLGPIQTQTQQPDSPTQQPDSPTHILMLSLPNDDDDAVFVTPPENQFRSSSDYSDKRKRVDCDDEAQSKKSRVSQSDHSEKNVETEEIEENLVVVSDDELGDDDSVGITRNVEGGEQDKRVLSVGITRNVKEFEEGLDSRKTHKRVLSLGDKVVSVEITRNVEECSQGSSSKIDKRVESVVSIDDKVASVVGEEMVGEDCVIGGLGSEKVVETRVESSVCVGIIGNVEEHSQDGSLGRSKIDKRVVSVVSLGDTVASVVGEEMVGEDCVNGGLGSEKVVETRVESSVCVGIIGNVEEQSQDRSLGTSKMDKRVVSLGDKVASVVGEEMAGEDCVIGGLGSEKVVETRVESSVCVGIIENVEEHSQDGNLGTSKMDKLVSLGDKVASVVRKEKGLGSEKIVETRVETSVSVVDKVVENGRVDKDDVGAGTSQNGFEEIDKFTYKSNGDANKKQGKRKLPELIQGDDEDNSDVVEKEKEIDFYDVLKMLESAVGDGDGDGEEVDFLETAKKQGIVFPRPRWWHPEW